MKHAFKLCTVHNSWTDGKLASFCWLLVYFWESRLAFRRNFSLSLSLSLESSHSHSQLSFSFDGLVQPGPEPGNGGRAKDTRRSWWGGGLSGFAFGSIMLIKANEVMASYWYENLLDASSQPPLPPPSFIPTELLLLLLDISNNGLYSSRSSRVYLYYFSFLPLL